MSEEHTQIMDRAEALLKEARTAPGSGEMADRLWAMRRELLTADLHLTLEGRQLFDHLHEQWMTHRY